MEQQKSLLDLMRERLARGESLLQVGDSIMPAEFWKNLDILDAEKAQKSATKEQ
jgi:hypothetical protein